MPRENIANFATGTLNSSMTTTSTTFTLQTGQGASFPAGNFLVVIDTEAIQIYSVSGDTFTIGTNARGYDGTQVASHAIGATVQIAALRYNFYHLWQNVADAYNPMVPPVQIPGRTAPSSYDNEFDYAGGAWSLYPSASSGSNFSIGSDVASHLLVSRAQGDNTFYTAYVPFTPSGAFSLTCKLSQGTSLLASGGDQAQAQFFVCDQSNPTAGSDTGNRFRMILIDTPDTSGSSATNSRYLRTSYTQSGVNNFLNPTIPLPIASSVYLRIVYNGAGVWSSFVGDGIVYTFHQTKSSLSFTPQSMGFSFSIYNPSHNWVPQVAAIDFVRMVGYTLPGFGS